MKFKALSLALGKTICLVFSAGALAVVLAQTTPVPTTHLPTPASAAPDTTADELVELDMGDGAGESDSAKALALPKTRADSVVLIRHQFNHREQIIAGGVVMACLAAMMAIMNNYNPR